jgi:DNA-binding HxlR family transcriptional regulator
VSVSIPHVTEALTTRAEECRVAKDILSLIGDKWSMLVVLCLSPHSRRFSDIQRSLHGISQRMLTRTLRTLERDGLVLRTVTPTIPPRVDYELTALGVSLKQSLEPFGQWARESFEAVKAARARYDSKPVRQGGGLSPEPVRKRLLG